MNSAETQNVENECLRIISKVLGIVERISDHNIMFRARKNCLSLKEKIENYYEYNENSIIEDINRQADILLNSVKILYVNGDIDSFNYEEIISSIDTIISNIRD